MASRLGYRVRYKGLLAGRREVSLIWQYGVELQYNNENPGVKPSRFWLCKACHEAHRHNDALLINGTAHITNHLIKVHRINPGTGLLPDDPTTPIDPWAAAKVAGSAKHVAHTPWEEDKFQNALIDWTIVNDMSFSTATAAATRGLLTWNRRDLLQALPQSASTMSSYVHNTLAVRKAEIATLLETARSKISVSVDVWTSRNHYSFLAIVAHFVGKPDPLHIRQTLLTHRRCLI